MGAAKLADFLDLNGNQMKVLVLHWNKIGSPGGLRIAQSLKKNQQLKILDLSWNQIGKYGERSVATMTVSDIKKKLGGKPSESL